MGPVLPPALTTLPMGHERGALTVNARRLVSTSPHSSLQDVEAFTKRLTTKVGLLWQVQSFSRLSVVIANLPLQKTLSSLED